MWDVLQPKESIPVSNDELRHLVAAYEILLHHYGEAKRQQGWPQSGLMPWQGFRTSGIDDQFFQWLLYQDHAEHFRQGSAAAVPVREQSQTACRELSGFDRLGRALRDRVARRLRARRSRP
jgi:hypothetical protein